VTINHNLPSNGVQNTHDSTLLIINLKGSDSKVPSGSFDILVEAPGLTTSYRTTIN
jgi:hypothetical protein